MQVYSDRRRFEIYFEIPKNNAAKQVRYPGQSTRHPPIAYSANGEHPWLQLPGKSARMPAMRAGIDGKNNDAQKDVVTQEAYRWLLELHVRFGHMPRQKEQ